ncbi:hypothetical protein DSO57_1024982 [Entomophthora muscae]|uniref:Uncharacterized protein n=1 Tax=Entomophthora muscae TaxID=34485 RepID=A0ACC2SFI0_9FUNG|nr:hypothetical protein DSO57_1024982 [Entomophthora muscae]
MSLYQTSKLYFAPETSNSSLKQFKPGVRNDNLDVPESQSIKPGLTPEQNPLQTVSYKDWESESPQLIFKVVANPPGPKHLTTTQGSTSKPSVQDARIFPKVPTPDTSGLLVEMHELPNESYSKLPQTQEVALNPNACPTPKMPNRRIQSLLIPKQPVPNTTLPSKTPNANLPELKKPNQKMKPTSTV